MACKTCEQLAEELGTPVDWTCWTFYCPDCPTASCKATAQGEPSMLREVGHASRDVRVG